LAGLIKIPDTSPRSLSHSELTSCCHSERNEEFLILIAIVIAVARRKREINTILASDYVFEEAEQRATYKKLELPTRFAQTEQLTQFVKQIAGELMQGNHKSLICRFLLLAALANFLFSGCFYSNTP